ncbi:MAG TPA: hypothetical protein VHV76_15000 [Mycobacteriales bacterium]|jgi:hypothetical protein|nr:hypothetical protein [Mycobacteriales bacterium]
MTDQPDDMMDAFVNEAYEARSEEIEGTESEAEIAAQEAALAEQFRDTYPYVIKTAIDGGQWDDLFRHLEENVVVLDELDDTAGLESGQAIDELAEWNPQWFADQLMASSSELRFALDARARVHAAVGALLVDDLPPLDDSQMPPLPPAPLPDDLPPPLLDEADVVRQLVEAEDIEGLFNFLVSNRARLQTVADALAANRAAGDALDSFAEANADLFDEWVAWAGDDVDQMLSERPRIRPLVKGKTRVTRVDAGPLATETAGGTAVRDTSESGLLAAKITQEARYGIQLENHLNLYGILNSFAGRMSDITGLLDRYPDAGAAFDDWVQARSKTFVDWSMQLRAADLAELSTRPSVRAAIASRDLPPSSASLAVSGFAGANDLQGLFEYLLEAPRHAAAIIENLHVTAADRLDALAQRSPAHFVGWFDWCGDAAVQVALLSRPAISAVVTSVRNSTPLPDSRDSDSSDSGSQIHTELPGFRAENDADSGVPVVDPDVAEAVATTRELLMAGALGALLGHLSSILRTPYAAAFEANLDEGLWRQVDAAATAQPRVFAERVAGCGDPAVDELLARRPVIAAVLREQRRVASFATLTDRQLREIDDTNGESVKDLDNGGSTTWVVGGVVLLIGNDHDADIQRYVNSQPDRMGGSVRVRKGGMFGSGALTFDDCPAAKQTLVTSAVKRFSSKKVVFDSAASSSQSRSGRRQRR